MLELETKQENKEEILKPVSYAFFKATGSWCIFCLIEQPQTKEQVLAIHKCLPRNDPGAALPYQPFN